MPEKKESNNFRAKTSILIVEGFSANFLKTKMNLKKFVSI